MLLQGGRVPRLAQQKNGQVLLFVYTARSVFQFSFHVVRIPGNHPAPYTTEFVAWHQSAHAHTARRIDAVSTARVLHSTSEPSEAKEQASRFLGPVMVNRSVVPKVNSESDIYSQKLQWVKRSKSGFLDSSDLFTHSIFQQIRPFHTSKPSKEVQYWTFWLIGSDYPLTHCTWCLDVQASSTCRALFHHYCKTLHSLREICTVLASCLC